MSQYSINPVSEDTLLVHWRLENDLASPELTTVIAQLIKTLMAEHADSIVNLTPAYQTLLVRYDLMLTNAEEVTSILNQSLIEESDTELRSPPVVHKIPVLYDVSVAADLNKVCATKQLTIKDLIEAHTSCIYDVYAVGFMPGFAYLGYVPESLEIPRHSAFNGSVPEGSVGIADRQTAVYPCESPGGWQIVGRTPIAMLEKSQSLLRVGDQVQFVSISEDEYRNI